MIPPLANVTILDSTAQKLLCRVNLKFGFCGSVFAEKIIRRPRRIDNRHLHDGRLGAGTSIAHLLAVRVPTSANCFIPAFCLVDQVCKMTVFWLFVSMLQCLLLLFARSFILDFHIQFTDAKEKPTEKLSGGILRSLLRSRWGFDSASGIFMGLTAVGLPEGSIPGLRTCAVTSST